MRKNLASDFASVSMESSTIFPTLVSIVFDIWAAVALYQYAVSGTRKRVLFVSYLGFVVPFACVLLISFDIDNTLANRYRSFLYYTWRILYWTLQLLSWIIFPFNMEKERSGSWRKSLETNAIWWGIYVVVGLAAVIYFFGMTDYGFQGMLAFAYAASNTFGLLLIILLAGYGLVAAPKYFYLKSKPDQYLEYLYIQAVNAEDARLAAKYDLQDAYIAAKKKLDPTDPNMTAVSKFLSSTYGVNASSAGGQGSGNTPDPDTLTALRDALMTARRSVSAWTTIVKECILYENVYAKPEDAAVSQFEAMTQRTYGVFLRVFSICTGLLSGLIIFAQSTIFIDAWWLSLIAVVFRKGVWENPSVLEGAFASFFIQALITIPPVWIFYCCYFSLTKLKLGTYYGLYPNHNTDTLSLVWYSCMFIRISFALVYNYLLVLRIPDHPSTVFEEMQGWMNVVPLLGDSVTEYFPLLILVVALMTLSNTYSKMMTCLGLTSLQFEAPTNPATKQKLVDEGKKLILRERQTRRASIEHVGLSLAKPVGSLAAPNSIEMGLTKVLGRNNYVPLDESN